MRNKYGFRIVLIYANGTNQRKQIGGYKKKTDVEIQRNQIIAELYIGKYVLNETLAVGEYFDMWLNDVMKPKIKVSTYITYTYNLKNHIIPKIGGITVSKLNRGHIVELYRAVSQHSLESAKLSRVIIQTALRYAEQNNYIACNPAVGLKYSDVDYLNRTIHIQWHNWREI